MKITSLILSTNSVKPISKQPAKPAVAPAKIIPAPQKPVQAVPSKLAAADKDRRRGQRVLLRIRANIHVALQGHATTFDASTLSVTPHGAVVVMKQNLPVETRLVLEHGGTKQCVACKVPRAARETPEGFQVPVEFDSPAPGFWKIDFPPSDWRPDDV